MTSWWKEGVLAVLHDGFCIDLMPLDSTIEGNRKMLLKVLSTSLMLFDRKSLLLEIIKDLLQKQMLQI